MLLEKKRRLNILLDEEISSDEEKSDKEISIKKILMKKIIVRINVFFNRKVLRMYFLR